MKYLPASGSSPSHRAANIRISAHGRRQQQEACRVPQTEEGVTRPGPRLAGPGNLQQLGDERGRILPAFVELSVDEEGGRSLHPAPDASQIVGADPGSMDSGRHFLPESLA